MTSTTVSQREFDQAADLAFENLEIESPDEQGLFDSVRTHVPESVARAFPVAAQAAHGQHHTLGVHAGRVRRWLDQAAEHGAADLDFSAVVATILGRPARP
jgi:hypothetical protein